MGRADPEIPLTSHSKRDTNAPRIAPVPGWARSCCFAANIERSAWAELVWPEDAESARPASEDLAQWSIGVTSEAGGASMEIGWPMSKTSKVRIIRSKSEPSGPCMREPSASITIRTR
jgi:hypothetical protein